MAQTKEVIVGHVRLAFDETGGIVATTTAEAVSAGYKVELRNPKDCTLLAKTEAQQGLKMGFACDRLTLKGKQRVVVVIDDYVTSKKVTINWDRKTFH